MKKLVLACMVFFLSLTFVPTQVRAESGSSNATEQTAANRAQATLLYNRLVAIKKMDKSQMSSSEKKELRTEVRSIRKQFKELAGGVYLSTAAVIIIILLLIILI